MSLRIETRGRVLVVTLDRPAVHNSIDAEMYRQLIDLWPAFDADEKLAVAVITGAGEKSFCSGMDLVNAMGVEAAGTGETARSEGHEPGEPGDDEPPPGMVPACAKPVIAAINGHCLAGGLAIALGCDLRLCSPNATFGTMAIKRGIIAAAGQIQRLTRYIPFGKAMELILLGERIDAAEAHRIGLVNHVVPAEQLLERALVWAETMCQYSPLALRLSKQAAYQGGLGLPLEAGLRQEAQLFARVIRSEDAAEGLLAFAEKRPARFTGR